MQTMPLLYDLGSEFVLFTVCVPRRVAQRGCPVCICAINGLFSLDLLLQKTLDSFADLPTHLRNRLGHSHWMNGSTFLDDIRLRFTYTAREK